VAEEERESASVGLKTRFRTTIQLGTLVAANLGMNLPLETVLCLLPSALVLAIIFRKRQEQQIASCAPFDESLRRPVGETLRVKLESKCSGASYSATPLCRCDAGLIPFQIASTSAFGKIFKNIQ